MLINNFSKHIFWSYKKDANLPDDVVLQQVIIHGEIQDLVRLTELFDKQIILKALDKIKTKYPKRVNFITAILL